MPDSISREDLTLLQRMVNSVHGQVTRAPVYNGEFEEEFGSIRTSIKGLLDLNKDSKPEVIKKAVSNFKSIWADAKKMLSNEKAFEEDRDELTTIENAHKLVKKIDDALQNPEVGFAKISSTKNSEANKAEPKKAEIKKNEEPEKQVPTSEKIVEVKKPEPEKEENKKPAIFKIEPTGKAEIEVLQKIVIGVHKEHRNMHFYRGEHDSKLDRLETSIKEFLELDKTSDNKTVNKALANLRGALSDGKELLTGEIAKKYHPTAPALITKMDRALDNSLNNNKAKEEFSEILNVKKTDKVNAPEIKKTDDAEKYISDPEKEKLIAGIKKLKDEGFRTNNFSPQESDKVNELIRKARAAGGMDMGRLSNNNLKEMHSAVKIMASDRTDKSAAVEVKTASESMNHPKIVDVAKKEVPKDISGAELTGTIIEGGKKVLEDDIKKAEKKLKEAQKEFNDGKGKRTLKELSELRKELEEAKKNYEQYDRLSQANAEKLKNVNFDEKANKGMEAETKRLGGASGNVYKQNLEETKQQSIVTIKKIKADLASHFSGMETQATDEFIKILDRLDAGDFGRIKDAFKDMAKDNTDKATEAVQKLLAEMKKKAEKAKSPDTGPLKRDH